MTYDEFTEAFFCFLNLALSLSRKSRDEGILSLEDSIDPEKAANREIFEYGMRFMIDGTDLEVIDKLLSNIINHEKNTHKSLLKTIEKEAVLMIGQGWNPRIILHLLYSYVDFPLSDPRFKELLND